MPIAKIRYSDQARWSDAKRVDVVNEDDALQIIRETMSCFQLNWADYQIGPGPIKTIYANEAMRHNREMAILRGLQDC